MLIDTSYFRGPLTIAQLGEKSVDDSVKDFINKWEPVIMEAALGYDFYQAFLAGLDVDSDDTPEQRWLDLLNGVAFTNTAGIKKRFSGFAGGLNTQTVIGAQRDDLTIYAGITPGFPVGGYQYTNSTLKNWNFTLELFGAGTLEYGVEWEYKPGGGWQMIDTTYTTLPEQRWIIHFKGKRTVTVQSGSQNLLSPIAGFVFYEYMKDLTYQKTGIGVVKSKGENSVSGNPAYTMADAYNDACTQMQLLHELLYTDSYKQVKVYPEFDPRQISYCFFGEDYCGYHHYEYYDEHRPYSFRKINTFGI